MENTPRLYDTLVGVLSQHRNWLDRRHLQTLAWMMVGLILLAGDLIEAQCRDAVFTHQGAEG